MAVKAIPDDYPRVMPYLSIDGASDAIEFYKTVFGAEEQVRMDAPGGKIGHAEIGIGDSKVMLADTFPDMGGKSPKQIGGSPGTIMVYVEDVDAGYQRALAGGAPAPTEGARRWRHRRTQGRGPVLRRSRRLVRRPVRAHLARRDARRGRVGGGDGPPRAADDGRLMLSVTKSPLRGLR